MISNAMELTELIENTLGCPPPNPRNVDPWKARVILAGRIKRQVSKDPKKLTWSNLEAAVSYIRFKQIVINSPMAIFYYVDKALHLVAETEAARPVEDRIDDAISYEHEHHLPGWSRWIDRLVRAVGPARQGALLEWKQERGQ